MSLDVLGIFGYPDLVINIQQHEDFVFFVNEETGVRRGGDETFTFHSSGNVVEKLAGRSDCPIQTLLQK